MTTTPGSPDMYAGNDEERTPHRDGTAFFSSHIEYKLLFDRASVTDEEMQEYRQRREAEEKAERQRLARAAQFPVEGLSGEWEHSLTVWRTDGYEHDRVAFQHDDCGLCGRGAACVTGAYGYDDYMPVCRGCLNKIFDVFEAHASEGE